MRLVLERIMNAALRIGGFRLKDTGTVMQVRDGDDTVFFPVGVKELRIYKDNATESVVITVPSSLAATTTFVFPGVDGSTGQLLGTNGSGTLGWYDSDSNANKVEEQAFDQTTTTQAVFTPPANASQMWVMVKVTGAAAGGSPDILVGTAGDTDAYIASADVDLSETGEYWKYEVVDYGGTPAQVVITVTPDSQTFAGTVYICYALAT